MTNLPTAVGAGRAIPDAATNAARLPSLATFQQVFPRTEIHAGVGSADELAESLALRGGSRAMVVCGQTVSRGPQLGLLRTLIGDQIVDVFDGVRKHGGLSGAIEGARRFQAAQANALVSLGGGSTIDSAKCIALILAVGDRDLERFRVQEHDGQSVAGAPIPDTALHVAIPTTAGSASEVMPWAGIRDEERREKMLFRDVSLVPQIAVLDPRFVALTNAELTSTSAVTSVARSIETVYSTARQPISDALALSSLRLMLRALPSVLADGGDLAARRDTQIAATLSGIAAENSMVSLVHAIGHAVGGRLALQHGVSHAIMLPSVAELCLPTLDTEVLGQVTLAMGADPAGLTRDAMVTTTVQAFRSLLGSLPLATRLREVGLPESEIDEVADYTLHDPMFGFTPVSIDGEQIRDLLKAAW